MKIFLICPDFSHFAVDWGNIITRQNRIGRSEFKSRFCCIYLGQSNYSLGPLFCYFLSEGLTLISWRPSRSNFFRAPISLMIVWKTEICFYLYWPTFHHKFHFISFPICSPANNSLPRIREGLSYHTKPSNFPTRPGVSQDFLPKIILASNNFFEFSIIAIIINKNHFLS